MIRRFLIRHAPEEYAEIVTAYRQVVSLSKITWLLIKTLFVLGWRGKL